MLKRRLHAALAVLGLLILAGALAAQAPEAISVVPEATMPVSGGNAQATVEPTGGEPTPDGASQADLDLSAAARTYKKVYDRLSYGDRHLVEQLDTNRKRKAELEKRLETKRAERKRLEENVADQLGRIKRAYPTGEGKEAMMELAHEYETTKKDLDTDISSIQADLIFAAKRIQVVDEQLRTIHARSVSKGHVSGKARLMPAPSASSVDATIVADLERLRRRVLVRRVQRLTNLEAASFEPASCGQPSAFRTKLFQAMK